MNKKITVPVRATKKADIKAIIARLQLNPESIERHLSDVRAQEEGYDHFGNLLDAAIDLMRVPDGVSPADHFLAIGGPPAIEEKSDSGRLLKYIELANRSDFCAFIAYELFMQALEMLADSMIGEAFQRMSQGAFFLARSSSAAVIEERSAAAASGPEERLKSDPRQIAKAAIKKRYLDWKKGLEKFKSGAEFARKMDLEFPGVLDGGAATIRNWVSEWDRARRNEPKL